MNTLFAFCLLKRQWNPVLNYLPTMLHCSVSIPVFESQPEEKKKKDEKSKGTWEHFSEVD